VKFLWFSTAQTFEFVRSNTAQGTYVCLPFCVALSCMSAVLCCVVLYSAILCCVVLYVCHFVLRCHVCMPFCVALSCMAAIFCCVVMYVCHFVLRCPVCLPFCVALSCMYAILCCVVLRRSISYIRPELRSNSPAQ
jgi:hypothetical protein